MTKRPEVAWYRRRYALVWLVFLWLCLIASSVQAATFVVQEATESALRNAIIQANETPGLDRVEFADGIDSIPITRGQIEIFDSLEIVGRAGAPVTLRGNGNSRIFAVIDPGQSFPSLDLSHLIIEGGGTVQPGTRVVNDLGRPDCSASTGDGGAICSEAFLRLNEVIVRDSQTAGTAADGGGIWAADGVELVFSSVANNRLMADNVLGAGIYNQGGEVICDSSDISGNVAASAESSGGGIAAVSVSATNCVVSNNEAAGGAGVFSAFIELFASTLEGNTAQIRGGGMLAAAATPPDTQSSMSSLLVINSTISGNQAGAGGGIFAIAGDQADFLIANSTIIGNRAPSVGGVEILDAFDDFALIFFETRANDDKGIAVVANGKSGTDHRLAARADNRRRQGKERALITQKSSAVPTTARAPGLGVELGRIGGRARFGRPQESADPVFEPEIVSTIIAENLNDGQFDPNLAFTPSDGRETNLIEQNSLIPFGLPNEVNLAPLADNGCFETAGAAADPGAGCPRTHRLLANAFQTIEQGLNLFELEFDQRGSGFPRAISNIDIGAYEFQPLGIAQFFISPDVLQQGESFAISWSVVPDREEVSCVGSGLPGTVWDDLALENNGELLIETSGLLPGEYFVTLECQRDAELAFLEIPLQVQAPIELSLELDPDTVSLGEVATVSWDAVPDDSATSCSAESTPPVAVWTGSLANSGSIGLDTGQIPPGVYQLALRCARGELSKSTSVALEVIDEPLEISIDISANPVIVGDVVSIDWVVSPGDEFSSCTGFGLDGTEWNDVREPTGSFILDTAVLGSGSFEVGLGCSRPEQFESVTVPLVVEPLELSLSVEPGTLIRGDDLSVSWAGTDGLICAGSGLPGTVWDRDGKDATGTQVVNTEPLEPNSYQVRLTCERQGIAIQRERELIVLARPADLALSAAIVDMGIAGSDFVEFSISNTSQNRAFDLAFEVAAPANYQIAGVFIRAPECTISEDDPNQVSCDLEAIGDWQCENADGTAVCGLAELPANALTGVVIELRGQGATSVSGSVEASNADARVAEIGIGSGEAP